MKKIAELTKGTVKEIVCQKDNNTFLFKYTDSLHNIEMPWIEVTKEDAYRAIEMAYGEEKAKNIIK